MSESSDFESVTSDLITSQYIKDGVANVTIAATNNSGSTKFETEIIRININDDSSILDSSQHNASFTDSDHSLLEVPKLFNVSSPSSICSIKPLEWDSGADVGYDITSKQLTQDMSTIERMAVSNIVYNSNSTPIDYKEKISLKTKCNSLINLDGIELSKAKKSASFETLKYTGMKSETLPKSWSPITSSLSVSTVVHKLESLNSKQCMNHFNMLFEQQEKRFEELKIDSNNKQKLSDSSKESNSTLGSADTSGSWVAKEFHNSTNTTTDRVNSFEYLPGNAFYNDQKDVLSDYSDKEIKQHTKMLIEAMKHSGLKNELQRKKIFEKVIESFLKSYTYNENDLSTKITSDHDQTSIRQEFTPQTSNTANTIVDNQKNNQSSTITFTSPITSSQYGDDIDSKYDEFSLDSGRHINLQKYTSKKTKSPTKKQKNQGVQCTIQNSFKSLTGNKNQKKSESSKSKSQHKNVENIDYHPKKNNQNCLDINQEFKKQMIRFHKKYMKTERENQMLWINSQISQLNNLKKLLNTHEELKRNWNSYKQKQTANNKSKSRSFIPTPNSSTDISSTTKTTDSTISSKLFSVSSRCDDTDTESSTSICNHIHYKKGVLVTEPKSIQKCCEKTLHEIDEKQKQNNYKFKTTWSQTEPINETKFKSYKNNLNNSDATYSVDHKLISPKDSICYDIIFKPNIKCLKEIDNVKNKPELKTIPKTHSISVACQTSEIPFNPKSSLQEYLITNRPDYICRAKERQNILSDLANLRKVRRKLKTNIIISNNFEKNIPPNPLAVKRIMTQKEMRKQTELKYQKCSEVENKKVEKKRKEEYKTNKIMATVFNKRLQKKTLNGNVDLSNSVSVSSL